MRHPHLVQVESEQIRTKFCQMMIMEEDTMGRICTSCEDKYEDGKSSVASDNEDEWQVVERSSWILNTDSES